MKKDKENILLKVEMYFVSLYLLFVFLFILLLNGWSSTDTFLVFLEKNMWSQISMILVLISYCCCKNMQRMFKGTLDLPTRIKNVKNKDYEYLTFLTTYIIPLVGLDLSKTRYIVILVVLLVVIGIIFIKAEFYLANPTLALLGYRLYELEDEDGKDYVVITKDRLKDGDYMETIPFDNHALYARRRENK